MARTTTISRPGLQADGTDCAPGPAGHVCVRPGQHACAGVGVGFSCTADCTDTSAIPIIRPTTTDCDGPRPMPNRAARTQGGQHANNSSQYGYAGRRQLGVKRGADRMQGGVLSRSLRPTRQRDPLARIGLWLTETAKRHRTGPETAPQHHRAACTSPWRWTVWLVPRMAAFRA